MQKPSEKQKRRGKLDVPETKMEPEIEAIFSAQSRDRTDFHTPSLPFNSHLKEYVLAPSGEPVIVVSLQAVRVWKQLDNLGREDFGKAFSAKHLRTFCLVHHVNFGYPCKIEFNRLPG